jgi:long-chain acyl-CoA synthetase
MARRRSRNLIEPLLERGGRPDACAALHFGLDGLQGVSWGWLLERVRALSEALIARGVGPGDRVCVFAAARLDGAVADLAIAGARAVTVPLHPSSTVAEVEHVLRDSGARVAIVDGDVAERGAPGRWSRLRAAMARVPAVDQVVAFDLPSDPGARVVALGVLEACGRAMVAGHPGGLEARSATLGEGDVASICYTGRRAGAARGVLLTHGNWTAQALAIPQVGLLAGDDVVLTALPLADVFGRAVQAAWVDRGFPLAFARSPETVLDDAAMVGATAIPAVPQLLESLLALLVGHGGALPGVRGRLFRWGMRQFDQHAAARMGGRDADTPRWRIARELVFARVGTALRERLGGRVRGFISGTAPVSQRLAILFEQCGLPVLEGYGQTETAGPTHLNRLDGVRLGTAGLPFPGVETRIAVDGEVLVRGPQVMKGYHGLPALTAEVLDADGWLHTGDLGEVDAEGCLRITGRKVVEEPSPDENDAQHGDAVSG